MNEQTTIKQAKVQCQGADEPVFIIFGEPGNTRFLCRMDSCDWTVEKQREHAWHTVRALNCHDSLVEACEQISEWYELVKQNYPDMAGLLRGMDLARAALAEAKP